MGIAGIASVIAVNVGTVNTITRLHLVGALAGAALGICQFLRLGVGAVDCLARNNLDETGGIHQGNGIHLPGNRGNHRSWGWVDYRDYFSLDLKASLIEASLKPVGR
jgi:hypothetical protein